MLDQCFRLSLVGDPSSDFGGEMTIGGTDQRRFVAPITYIPITSQIYCQFKASLLGEVRKLMQWRPIGWQIVFCWWANVS
uniref:Uncharacterized protein n=1 Tax=Globodera pallida TaxID=36090 RepID=A0A183CJK4_GLOPA